MKYITQIIFTNLDKQINFKEQGKEHKTTIADGKQIIKNIFEGTKAEKDELIIIDVKADYESLASELNKIKFKTSLYLIGDDEQTSQQIKLLNGTESTELKAYELTYYNTPDATYLSNSQDELNSLVDDLINDIEALQDENDDLRNLITDLTNLLIKGDKE